MSAAPLALGDVAEPLRLVQITDTHLSQLPGGTLLGLDTDHSLQRVIELAQAERSRIDLVVATGDIADNGSEAAYRRAREYMGRLCEHTLWLAGNHDLPDNMRQVLGAGGELVREARSDHWQILLLDSQIPGEVGGELGARELRWLESSLRRRGDGLHSLVCLHHQPLPTGSAWIDRQMLSDHEAFFLCLERCGGVRGVMWGHVHQQSDSLRGEMRLMSTPSSCVQFAPHSEEFKVDDAAPGYRWLDLYADGRIDSAVSRVTGVDFAVDCDARGYS